MLKKNFRVLFCLVIYPVLLPFSFTNYDICYQQRYKEAWIGILLFLNWWDLRFYLAYLRHSCWGFFSLGMTLKMILLWTECNNYLAFTNQSNANLVYIEEAKMFWCTFQKTKSFINLRHMITLSKRKINYCVAVDIIFIFY